MHAVTTGAEWRRKTRRRGHFPNFKIWHNLSLESANDRTLQGRGVIGFITELLSNTRRPALHTTLALYRRHVGLAARQTHCAEERTLCDGGKREANTQGEKNMNATSILQEVSKLFITGFLEVSGGMFPITWTALLKSVWSLDGIAVAMHPPNI